ncbi:MAG TPA: ribosome silencing factor [Candidatus Izemoplasmatales bacterium]|nr:ribosome silencing factor [Candidatus Izemoplasmatales bacterium]
MSIRLKSVYETLTDLKLYDIIIYDFKGVSPFFDYQIIASASNERQAHASIQFIKKILTDEDDFHVESDANSRWVLIDLKRIIIHVMHKDTRNDYQIEKLFYDREKIAVEDIEDGV